MTALFEGAKGLLVLLAGCGILAWIHKDLHEAATQLVSHFHFNPASHYPQIFLDLLSRVNDTQLRALAAAAIVYALVRFFEAVGLWLDRSWAEWFGILTGAIYLPLELFELTRGVTWPKITVVVVNSLVVILLSVHVALRRQRS